jgi:hypothetical protein
MEPKQPSFLRQLLGSAASGFAHGLAIILGCGLVGAIIGTVAGLFWLGPVGAVIGALAGAVVVGGGAIMFAGLGSN